MKKILNALRPLCLFPLLIVAGGCGRSVITVNVIGEKSALENQILGTYQEIGEDVMLLASVRSVDKSGKLKENLPISDKKKRAIRAMQRRSFNRDDLDRFKALGVVGEDNRGYLRIINPDKLERKKRKFLEEIVRQENVDRKIVLDRVIEVNETFTAKDIGEIEKTFAKLNRDNAKPGEWLQDEKGEWVKK